MRDLKLVFRTLFKLNEKNVKFWYELPKATNSMMYLYVYGCVTYLMCDILTFNLGSQAVMRSENHFIVISCWSCIRIDDKSFLPFKMHGGILTPIAQVTFDLWGSNSIPYEVMTCGVYIPSFVPIGQVGF